MVSTAIMGITTTIAPSTITTTATIVAEITHGLINATSDLCELQYKDISPLPNGKYKLLDVQLTYKTHLELQI